MALRHFPREREALDPQRSYVYDSTPDEEESAHSHGWESYDPWHEAGLDIVDFARIAPPRPDSLQRSNVEVYARFVELRDEWIQATLAVSSVHEMVMHHAYQQIIGLGPQVVPFMIDELRSGPQHYFWALTAIVGVDHGAGADTMRRAAAMWIEWFDQGR